VNALVTIGIPSYNRYNPLKKLLECIVRQTYANIEVIISDNCSNDPNIEILLKEYSNKYSNFQYFIQDSNIGPSNNFLFLLKKATGDYFMWASDDDWFDSNYVEECMKLHNEKNCALVSGIGVYLDQNDNIESKDGYFNLDNECPVLRTFKYFLLVKRNAIFYGIYKKEYLENLHFETYVSADLTFIAQISMLGKIVKTKFSNKYISLGGSTENRQKMVKTMNYGKIKSIFFEILTSYNATFNIYNHPKLINYNKGYKLATSIVFFITLTLNMFVTVVKRRILRISI